MEVLKVSAKSNSNPVVGALSSVIRERGSAGRQEFGAADIANKSGFCARGSDAQDVSNTDSGRCKREQRRQNAQQPANRNWWAAEPRMGRVANGVPNRVDRITCLGNAVVPQQFYPIFKAIAKCEEGEK